MTGDAVDSCTESSQNECDLKKKKSMPAQDINQPLTSLLLEEEQERDDEAILQRLLDAVDNLPNDQSLLKFKVGSTTYARLSAKIERNIRRHDYDPDRSLLVVRMPSTTHGCFSTSVARHLTSQIDTISARDDKVGHFASKILNLGSASISLKRRRSQVSGPSLHRQPDIQFRYENTIYPGVVIEVSYSQNSKELRHLAQDYVLYSKGKIKLVIGIVISKDKECTIATWRPKFTTRVGQVDILETATDFKCRAFRSSDGETINADDCLEIDLSDFAAGKLTCGEETIKIHLPFAKLTAFLHAAEEWQKSIELGEEWEDIESSWPTLKRRFSSSSGDNETPGIQKKVNSER